MDKERENQVVEQKKLLTTHRRTLKHYLDQRAKLGSAHTPPGVTHGIEEAREDIQRIKGILRDWGVEIEDDPDDVARTIILRRKSSWVIIGSVAVFLLLVIFFVNKLANNTGIVFSPTSAPIVQIASTRPPTTQPTSVALSSTQPLITPAPTNQSSPILTSTTTGEYRTLRITSNGGNNYQPSFSRDGSMIVFTSDRDRIPGADQNIEIYTIDINGKNQQRLTNTPNIREDLPSFTPDGKHIIFSASDGQNEDIYVMDDDGKNVKNITNRPQSNEGRPRISRDGISIAFDSDETGDFEIYTADLSSDFNLINIHRRTNRPGYQDRLASFSPDGNSLIFRSELIFEGQSSSGIYLMDLDNGKLTNITKFTAQYADLYPVADPDGNGVTFVSDRSGSRGIYHVIFGNPEAVKIFDTEFIEDFPTYSRYQTKLAFSSNQMDGKFDIYIININ